MADLSLEDTTQLLAVARRTAEVATVDDFVEVALAAMHELVPSDLVGFNEVDPMESSIVARVTPDEAWPDYLFRRFEANMQHHPIVRYEAETGDGSPKRISDFFTTEEFHASPIYTEVYGEIGVEYMLAFGLPAPQPLVVAFALARYDGPNGDYSERDRVVADAARIHLVQAYRNVREREWLRTALSTLHRALRGRSVVLVDDADRFRSVTPDATDMLDEVRRDAGGRFDTWLAAERARLRGDDGPIPAFPLVVDGVDHRLVVRHLPAGPEPELLLIDEQPQGPGPEQLRALGLTLREAEVLALVARGQTNAEIAAALGTQPATVRKHLERVFRKLGVSRRTEAASVAYDALAFSDGHWRK